MSNGFKSDYCGFTVPNYFVVGNGFDFDEVMREMAHTGCLSPYGISYYTEHKLFFRLCSTSTQVLIQINHPCQLSWIRFDHFVKVQLCCLLHDLKLLIHLSLVNNHPHLTYQERLQKQLL